MARIATHKHMGNNLIALTSLEFAAIESYLSSKIILQKDCLPIMKTFKTITNLGYYVVAQKEAWEYFLKKYEKVLKHRGITEMSILLNRATEYALEYDRADNFDRLFD